MPKKSVAIMTYHRAYNYGAALQAYATVQYLKDAGFEPIIIDYCPNNILGYGTFRNLFNDVSNMNSAFPIRVAKAFLKSLGNRKRISTFDRFIDSEMPLTNKRYFSCQELKDDLPEADIYCSGSDQVWNNYYTKKFDPSYFLAFAPSGSTCISIASSFGKSSFNEEDSAFINNQLSKYTYLSVRETSGIKLLREMGYSDVDLMLDPTLLVSPDTWSRFAKDTDEESYVLLYQLHGDSDTANCARAYAKQHGLKIKSIITMPYQTKPGCQNIIAPDVHEWVGLFKGANCVFTDSFHGTVFSLVFNKPVAVTLPSHFSTRITTLLNAVGANDLICSDVQEWSSRVRNNDLTDIQRELASLCAEKQALLRDRLSHIG